MLPNVRNETSGMAIAMNDGVIMIIKDNYTCHENNCCAK